MKQCKKFDGCCATHGPCFEVVDEKSQGCQGWPCPVGRANELHLATEKAKARNNELKATLRSTGTGWPT